MNSNIMDAKTYTKDAIRNARSEAIPFNFAQFIGLSSGRSDFYDILYTLATRDSSPFTQIGREELVTALQQVYRLPEQICRKLATMNDMTLAHMLSEYINQRTRKNSLITSMLISDKLTANNIFPESLVDILGETVVISTNMIIGHLTSASNESTIEMLNQLNEIFDTIDFDKRALYSAIVKPHIIDIASKIDKIDAAMIVAAFNIGDLADGEMSKPFFKQAENIRQKQALVSISSVITSITTTKQLEKVKAFYPDNPYIALLVDDQKKVLEFKEQCGHFKENMTLLDRIDDTDVLAEVMSNMTDESFNDMQPHELSFKIKEARTKAKLFNKRKRNLRSAVESTADIEDLNSLWDEVDVALLTPENINLFNARAKQFRSTKIYAVSSDKIKSL